MNQKTIQALLKATFPDSDKEDWIAAASREIKKDNPLLHLTWLTSDDIAVMPLYDKKDISELKYLNAFNLRPSDGFQGARAWSNLPCVSVVDETTANQTALEHLAKGADGILFSLTKRYIDISLLLKNIEWPYCNISFTGELTSIKKDIAKHINTGNGKALQGSIWGFNDYSDITLLNKLNLSGIQLYGIVVPDETPVREITTALTTAVKILDTLTNSGVDKIAAIKSIAFSISIQTDLCVEIAKLKALRMLWFQVAAAYSVEEYQPSDLQIHARVKSNIDNKFQPHGNLLNSTLGALGAVLGGCDSMTIYSEDESNTIMNRIARNVSNILREESHLNKVSDALAGSYAIEFLVKELSEKAWNEFTSSPHL